MCAAHGTLLQLRAARVLVREYRVTRPTSAGLSGIDDRDSTNVGGVALREFESSVP